MLKLFDLGARPARSPDAPPAVTATGGPASAPSGPASPTALVLDEWGLRRGRDLVAESDRLRAAGADALAAADYFGAAFDPDPALAPACADPRRHAFLARVLDAPEYRALRADTRLDDTAAAIAAAHLAEQFARLPAPDAAEKSGGDFGAELAALRAAAAAVDGARAEVAEFRDAAAALGLGPGAPGAGDPAAIAAVFRRVRNDPGIKRICELAGRFRRVARAKQRRKAAHGTGDVVGVVPGGDVGRLLPAELVRLAVPELELDALRRIAEGHALCREHHATEPVGKGPVLAVVDESGSMAGDKVHTAKALALALAWVARHQRRWAGLIAFSGGSGERLLALPPGRWDEGRLCDWLAAFIGRGSDLDVPVAELPRMYREVGAPVGVTDLVIVTDALCRIPAALRESFLAWRRAARVRAVALVVGGAAPGDLAAVCDETHAVPALDPASETVGRVLSL
ncbi:Marine sediment metagenome DNA, contig: S01H1_S27396 (Fragment) OS=marine sediment metagenome GN=S01H1_64016 PE=4 SV=1: VWA_2 [Gemmataceae bacterium]